MASPAEIADEIERLATHCRPPVMSVQQRVLWIEDWCSDLAQYPIEAIRAACTTWRHGEVGKFPTAGQMRGLCIANAPRQANRPGENEPWRELSDDEYAALSLNGKIRHHEILASRCGEKAGPMWRNGAPVQLADMPPAYHEWKRRQQNHHEEAQRLRSRKRLMDRSA